LYEVVTSANSESVIITKFYFVPSIIVLKVQKNQLTKTVIERKQFCLDRPRQLDPKGINNQIKEAIDKRYVTEDDDTLARLNDTGM
jgi:hypothetical protein